MKEGSPEDKLSKGLLAVEVAESILSPQDRVALDEFNRQIADLEPVYGRRIPAQATSRILDGIVYIFFC